MQGQQGIVAKAAGAYTCSRCVLIVAVRCRSGMTPNCVSVTWAGALLSGDGERSMPGRSHLLYDLVIGCVCIGILLCKCAS